ncbi:hypothetical protein [Sulfuricurvum sp.]|uniref:hypothetical protein n=1 Tax=Sulfuricurvum sp. TaxID=2025608 RepID=UPI003BB0F2CA
MATLDKGTLFWMRISLAIDVMNFIRETKIAAIKKENSFLNVKFKTHYAQMIWEIMRKYPKHKTLALTALHDTEEYEFDKKSSVNESDKDDITDAEYKKYEKVNHLLHLYHIVFYASQFEIDNKLIPDLLILTLLYSFGKNDTIKDKYGSNEFNLDLQVSAIYAISIMRSSDEYVEKAIKTIERIILNYNIYSKKDDNICKLIAIAEKKARALESQMFL